MLRKSGNSKLDRTRKYQTPLKGWSKSNMSSDLNEMTSIKEAKKVRQMAETPISDNDSLIES